MLQPWRSTNYNLGLENNYAQWRDHVIYQNVYEKRWTLGWRSRF
ncbi:MAG: hypothetical protein U5L02_02065 [Rheinheimera sp.]|nr:hypothetical protein [Rheinheimera sp.]